MIRRALSALLAASFLTSSLPASAQTKEACVAASESSQKLRKAKKLKDARKELVTCAQEACPAVVRKDCVTWLAEVDDSLPSIILAAKDGSGNDLSDVIVLLDGAPLVDKLDGAAITIDPGQHTLRFEPQKGDPVETKIVVREAEKKRVVTVTLGEKPKAPEPTAPPAPSPAPAPAPAPTPAPPEPSDGNRTASIWTLGAFGVLGLAGFTYFGLAGRADRQHLLDTCAPYCSKDDERAAKNKLVIADISLGVGVVSLGIATVLLVTAPSKPDAKKTGLHVDATPVAGGAMGFFGGTF